MEPADGDVGLSLARRQLAVVHDAREQTDEHQPNRYLGMIPGRHVEASSAIHVRQQCYRDERANHRGAGRIACPVAQRLVERPWTSVLAFAPGYSAGRQVPETISRCLEPEDDHSMSQISLRDCLIKARSCRRSWMACAYTDRA